MRGRRVVSGVGLVLLVCLNGCLEFKAPINQALNDSPIVIGIGNISGFYPWMSRDVTTCSVNKNIFNALVEFDKNTTKFINKLAVNWNNPNNVTWRFQLRQGVKFHNGDDFTAEDVKFTVEFLKAFNTFYAEELAPVQDIVVIDNYIIDIITDRPFPLLLNKMITMDILDKEYMESIAGTNVTWPIGTGPYRLVNYTKGEEIRLASFDSYWEGPPAVHNATFRIYNNDQEAKAALIRDEIDIASLKAMDVPEIEQIAGLQVRTVQTAAVTYLGFDCRANGSYGFSGSRNPTADVRVRTAIYQAIDIEAMIDRMFNGSAIPATQIITENTFGFNPAIVRLPYNLTRARELLQEAGYGDGFTIRFDCPDIAISLSEEIVQQLSAVNITVIPQNLPALDQLEELNRRNTSFFVFGISPLDGESTIRLLLCTPDGVENGLWNYGDYSNAGLDELAAQMLYTLEPYLRKNYMQSIFSIAADDVAYIPLYSGMGFFGVDAGIDWNPRHNLYLLVNEMSWKDASF